MMGLPEGHVTGIPLELDQLDLFPPDLLEPLELLAVRDREALRLLGNGVVPQQAAEGLRRLLPHCPIVTVEETPCPT
jgi:hypothetical protein